MQDTDFVKCFSDFEVGYYNSDFVTAYLEVVNDASMTKRAFTFTLDSASPVSFIGVEFYLNRLYGNSKNGCDGASSGYFSLYSKTGTALYTNIKLESSKTFSYTQTSLQAGTYYAVVSMTSYGKDALPEYSFKIQTGAQTNKPAISQLSASELVSFQSTIVSYLKAQKGSSLSGLKVQKDAYASIYYGKVGDYGYIEL